MDSEGWIKVHRKLLTWEWHDSPETAHLFVTLLLLANHEDEKWHGQTIHRGQIVTSRDKLAEQTGLSVQEVRTCLDRLKQTGEISKNSTNKFTVVTISNYDRYQVKELGAQPTINQQSTSNQPANNQQSTTNKNDKNIRIEEDIISSNELCPTEPSDAPEKTDDSEKILPDRHCQNVVDFWNRTVAETQSTLPQVLTLSDKRKKKMRIRWKEFKKVGDPVEVCRTIFTKVCTSKFCQGDNKTGWSADFDWVFTNGENWVKVYEGNYDNKPAQMQGKITMQGQQPSKLQQTINERNKFQQALHGFINSQPADSAPDSQ